MFLVEQTTAPGSALPVAILRDQLLIGSGFSNDNSQDSLLEQFLRSAIAAIEARTGKVLLEKQYTWSLTIWRDRMSQALPLAPVSAINEIRLLDGSGGVSVLPADDYRLVRDEFRPCIAPRSIWLPSIPNRGGVEIDFVAGYGPSWTDVPDDLGHAVIMLAAHYYENRRGAGPVSEMPFGISSLIQKFRNIRLLGGSRA